MATAAPLRYSSNVADAIARRQPVVALETSVIAQGLPAPRNAEAAQRMRAAVREAGAVPAFTAIVGGEPTLGLTDVELARFLRREGVQKASARDLPAAVAHGSDAATTVAGALALCRMAGVPVFATGGIGGVHRRAAGPLDESADLHELARAPVIVVSAGAKLVLDLPATVERLETLGVCVAGYRTREFPGFYVAATGIPVTETVERVEEVVALFRAQRRLGYRGALLLVQPPPAEWALAPGEAEKSVVAALEDAARAGVRGAETTPWLLGSIARHTSGRSLMANIALLEQNARLAGAVASALQSVP